jgi:uncharacterized protein
MSRWRIAILVGLVCLPVLFLVGVGGYALWHSGWAFYVWWPMAGCLAVAYFLGWYWHRKRRLVEHVEFTPPRHFTGRDAQAWQLVQARAEAAARVDPDKLSDPPFYLETAQEMALELARFYHPKAEDPVGPLTIPEILAVVELASHDLTELVDKNLPGGHFLTINDWRRAQQLTEWYRKASNVYWLVAAVFSPIETGLRYAAAQAGLTRPLQMLQQNLILWFFTHYVHRLGTYLIELNSGRLRVGSKRYRELMQQSQTNPPPAAEAPAPPPEADASQVTVTVFGQVKAGKSSFINALLGEQKARTDVLPATAGITRYELRQPDLTTKLVILDTVGYAHTGPRADQLRETEDAAQQADLLVLVLHARNPARQADLVMLQDLQAWFVERPHLKMPPIVAVVTHIDLLSPAMEWAPPYNWQDPKRPKEQQIQQALATVKDQLGNYLNGAVPVCVLPGKVHGVEEWFLPAFAQLVPDAKAVSLLRCLRQEADRGKIRKVLQQLLNVGTEMARAIWQNVDVNPRRSK